MKIYFEKRPQGLFPVSDTDKEYLQRIRNGAIFGKGFKKVRTVWYHKMVFHFLNTVYQFQNEFTNFDHFRKRLTLLAGYYDPIIMFDADKNPVTNVQIRSISYESMDQHEYEQYYKCIRNAAWMHYIKTEHGQDEIDRRVNQLMRFD